MEINTTINENDKIRMRVEYERTINYLVKNPPSFIDTSKGLHSFAVALVSAKEAMRRFVESLVQVSIKKIVDDAAIYQLLGYPYGKTQRGLKRWIKEHYNKDN